MYPRHRLARLLSASAIMAAMACGEQSPTGLEEVASPVLATANATATPLVFRMVSAGTTHSCGVTTGNLAYCWGHHVIDHIDRLQPTPVLGGLQFRHVSVGLEHSCGVTTGDRAYCWGSGGVTGKLGNGSNGGFTAQPVAVSGGLRFRQISAGINHTCAVTPEGVAYCWGFNGNGQLGDFTHTQRLTPKRVGMSYQWRSVSAGERHTCGVTTGNVAYCWGLNSSGQMGVANTIYTRSYPFPVSGGLRFQTLDAGRNHTCAVTTASRAYCWGDNSVGQLGDGTRTPRFTPRLVAGGRLYRQVSASYFQSCGLTTTGRELCWGSNPRGELGDGTTTDRLTPTPLGADLTFVQIGAGEGPSCGVTSAGRAYCWGENSYGQVGDGTRIQRLRPVPVAGPG